MDLSDTYDDRRPCLDTVVETETIANVTIRNHKAQIDNKDAREALPEVYAHRVSSTEHAEHHSFTST